jgi:hypothetical protein
MPKYRSKNGEIYDDDTKPVEANFNLNELSENNSLRFDGVYVRDGGADCQDIGRFVLWRFYQNGIFLFKRANEISQNIINENEPNFDMKGSYSLSDNKIDLLSEIVFTGSKYMPHNRKYYGRVFNNKIVMDSEKIEYQEHIFHPW